MKLIICVDKKNGLAFNKRRQTRDKEQRKHMLTLIGDALLHINPYSYELLSKDVDTQKLCASEGYLSEAGSDDFVFSEIDDISGYVGKADTIFIYRWDKLYLSDLRFDDKVLDNYICVKKEKFRGSSHEKIICEEYKKKTNTD